MKGLDNSKVGRAAARVRTIIVWRGDGWTGLASGGILISRSTTAVSGLANLRGLSKSQIVGLLGKISVGVQDSSLAPTTPDSFAESSGLSNADFHTAWRVVKESLNANSDPIDAVGRQLGGSGEVPRTWWNLGYRYRVPLTMVDGMGVARSNVLAQTEIDFASLLGSAGTLDPGSPRVVDPVSGEPLQAYFDDAANGVASDSKGTLRWLVPSLGASATRSFYVYLDVQANGTKAAPERIPSAFSLYYDTVYKYAWAGISREGMKTFLSSRGADIRNVGQTAAFMNWVVTNGISDTSVVMGNDVVPDVLASAADSTALIRRYCAAGGRVVWVNDTHLYYQGYGNNTMVNWNAGSAILGVGWGGSDGTFALTDTGRAWGLTVPWPSIRPVGIGEVSGPKDLILANSHSWEASAWLKNFNSNLPYSGFLRIWDTPMPELGNAQLSDLWNVATYRLVGRYALGTLESL